MEKDNAEVENTGASMTASKRAGKRARKVREISEDLLRWVDLPPPSNDKELAERVRMFFDEYAKTGEVPTIEKLALALGMSVASFNEFARGAPGASPWVREILSKAKNYLHAVESGLAIEGQMNPVLYIFRGKNYFGMVDKVEHTVGARDPLEGVADKEEMMKRINERIPEEV